MDEVIASAIRRACTRNELRSFLAAIGWSTKSFDRSIRIRVPTAAAAVTSFLGFTVCQLSRDADPDSSRFRMEAFPSIGAIERLI